jgi:hypothetical protein
MSARRRVRSVAVFSADAPALEPLEPRAHMDASLPLVTLGVADADAAERDQNQGRFVITRFGNTDAPLRVDFTISGGATPGVDYLGLATHATIPAGRRSVSLPIVPIDDLDVEGDESVRIVLAQSAGYRLGDALTDRNQKIIIRDDDVLPTVTVATPDAEAEEIGLTPATFTIRRTGPTDLPLTVSFRVAGSATPGDDYDALPDSVTILPGRRAAFVTVRPHADALFEGDETVRLTLRVSTDGRYRLTPGNPDGIKRTVVIRDRPLVGLAVTDPAGTSVPGDDAEFLVYRTGRTDAPLQVSYQAGGTAVMGTDYRVLPQFITIPAGQSSVRVRIIGLGGSLSAPEKTVRLTLLGLAGYNLNSGEPASVTGVVRLLDDVL